LDDGYIISSPNAHFIPYFETSKDIPSSMKTDMTWGITDYTLAPQMFMSPYPHFPCIPNKPIVAGDRLSVLWSNVTGDMFKCEAGVVEGLFRFDDGLHRDFCQAISDLHERETLIMHCLEAGQLQARAEKLRLLARHALLHLQYGPASRMELEFGVKELQRYLLELVGILTYAKVCLPRLDGRHRRAHMHDVPLDVLGCFAEDPHVVQWAVSAGIPTWFVRRGMQVPAHTVFNQFIRPIKHCFPHTTIERSPPFPVVFRGALKDHRRISVMREFSRMWVLSDDASFSHVGVDRLDGSTRIVATHFKPLSQLTGRMAEPIRQQPPSSYARNHNFEAGSAIRPSPYPQSTFTGHASVDVFEAETTHE
jgi:hypothetical protein